MGRYAFVVVVIALVLFAAIFVWYSQGGIASKYSSTNTPGGVLTRENEAYARAQTLSRAGNHEEAIAAYNEALVQAADYVQEAQIRFNIAATKYRQGDAIGAVRDFKELAEDKNNIPVLRAYAVQWIADINNAGNPEAAREVFSSSPYSEFVVPGDIALTNRKLAEYGSSIYPLGLLEMYIAIWYAEKLTETPPPQEAASYVPIIKQKMDNAEKDIERTKDDANGRGSTPHILQYEARVKAALAIAGAGSAQDAEYQFKRAFEAVAAYGLPAWYDDHPRLNYAIFLMRMYGNDRKSDIHATLSPIYENPVYKTAPIVSYLKNIAAGGPIDPKKKQYIGQLANYDTGWKTYLISLGWKESDFK
ncbi:tetratricopeptide repeat protein [Candidatus Parcubacteria bacterium]|nr:MAG: tetratricopeptide repeat protein [Candidatus Parcubacteria bacterium]